jgi:hypothetical protein
MRLIEGAREVTMSVGKEERLKIKVVSIVTGVSDSPTLQSTSMEENGNKLSCFS